MFRTSATVSANCFPRAAETSVEVLVATLSEVSWTAASRSPIALRRSRAILSVGNRAKHNSTEDNPDAVAAGITKSFTAGFYTHSKNKRQKGNKRLVESVGHRPEL